MRQYELPASYSLKAIPEYSEKTSATSSVKCKFNHANKVKLTERLAKLVAFAMVEVLHWIILAMESVLRGIIKVWNDVCYLTLCILFKVHYALLWVRYYGVYLTRKSFLGAAGLTFILDLDETLIHSSVEPPEKQIEHDVFPVMVTLSVSTENI